MAAGDPLWFAIITGDEALRAWRRALDADEDVGVTIFDATLFDDPSSAFVAAHDDEGVVSRCLLTAPATSGSSRSSPSPVMALGGGDVIRFV